MTTSAKYHKICGKFWPRHYLHCPHCYPQYIYARTDKPKPRRELSAKTTFQAMAKLDAREAQKVRDDANKLERHNRVYWIED
jgi:hypothetical protein